MFSEGHLCLQLAAVTLAEDADAAGGLDVDLSFAGATDVSRCGKLAALEALLATWYRHPAAGGRNKVRSLPWLSLGSLVEKGRDCIEHAQNGDDPSIPYGAAVFLVGRLPFQPPLRVCCVLPAD